MARDLMRYHGLSNWQFKWDRAKNRFGMCSHRQATIFMSSFITPHITVEKVLDTIAHEIAHALVGPNEGHNGKWRQKALELGSDGNAAHLLPITLPSKWDYVCADCGYTYKTNRRLTRLWARYHTPCRKGGIGGNLKEKNNF